MVKNGWVYCPRCKRKLFPVQPETVIKNLTYICKHCKHQFQVNI